MNRTTAWLTVLVLALGAIIGTGLVIYLGRDKPLADVAPPACVAALRQQLIEAQATGKEGTRPAACKGVSDAGLQAAAEKVMADAFGS